MPSPARDSVTVDFGAAMKRVVAGKKVARSAWGSGDCVFLHAEILHLRKGDGSLHTLIVSEGDLRGTDWIEVQEH